MTNEQWAELKSAGVSEYTLGGAVIVTEQRAVFRIAAPAEYAVAGSCLVICESRDQTTCEVERSRYSEAMFLQHPNLLRIFDTGCICSGGQWLHFAVTEPLEQPLTDVRDPITPAAWTRDVSAGLAYLHENNLVYCALSTASIWRAGGTWKLGDFGELRTPGGDYDATETRRLMLRRDLSVPPEAWEGIVTPAWDAWSLGTLLRITGSGETSVAQLLEPNPSERLSVRDFIGRATAPAMTREHLDASEPSRSPKEPLPPEPVSRSRIPDPPLPSAHAGRVHANAARLMRAPGPMVIWVSIAAAFALLILVVAVMWGQRGPSPRPLVMSPQAPANERHALANDPPAKEKRAPAESAPASPARAADPKQQINTLLERWAQATRTKDVDTLVNCYAPVVERFFGARDLRTNELRKAKRDAFHVIGAVRSFDIGNISFERLRPDFAVVSFRKRWDFPDRRFSGAERDEMELRRIGGEWKIVSEREVGQRKTEVGE